MYEKAVIIRNKTGLHARPATQLVQIAKKYGSVIEIVRGDSVANAKSVLNILALDLNAGSEVTIRAVGTDEDSAIEAIVTYIQNLKD